MNKAVRDVCSRAAKRVAPTRSERRRVRELLEKFTAKTEAEAKAMGLSVRVEVEGSIAKDTWIGTDRDLDVFIIFPRGTDGDRVKGLGLELAKASAGSKWSLGYAEHPYVEAEIDGFTLDIVPSLEMREGQKPTTAVDRTPLHTRFVRERLDEGGRREVRVLKQFLKGIGAYGAELKVGGFSGYIAELLVIRYGTFLEAIEAAAGWGERTCIDIAGHYRQGNMEEAFEGSLVMVDPVDRSRNAAAAVTAQSYFTFIAAARRFLDRPSLRFFFPKEAGVKSDAVLEALEAKGSHIVAVATSCPRVPSDILWGEAYRSMRRVASILEDGGFTVNDLDAWSDEKGALVFIFELPDLEIGRSRLHLGPMVTLPEEAERFLEKHCSERAVVAGPYIRGDRWAVELRRAHSSAIGLLAAKLKMVSLSKDVDRELMKGYEVLADGQLGRLMEGRPGLVASILRLLRKRPPWLSC